MSAAISLLANRIAGCNDRTRVAQTAQARVCKVGRGDEASCSLLEVADPLCIELLGGDRPIEDCVEASETGDGGCTIEVLRDIVLIRVHRPGDGHCLALLGATRLFAICDHCSRARASDKG